MKSLVSFVVASLSVVLPSAGRAQDVIKLRPAAKGTGAEKVEERGTSGHHDRAISDVVEPTLTVYLPPQAQATGVGIIICPGGGYQHLAIDKEGHDVAAWLTSRGVAAFVLKYRLPGKDNMSVANHGDLAQATAAARVALEDAEEAVRVVLAQAAHFGVRPESVGMMGFSAGGNLAALVAMTAPPAQRPRFLTLVYPAIPAALAVTAAMPPTFLAHADDDKLSAGDNSVRFYLALKKAGVPAELHVFASGGHGFGIKSSDKTAAGWTTAYEAWLRTLARPAKKSPS